MRTRILSLVWAVLLAFGCSSEKNLYDRPERGPVPVEDKTGYSVKGVVSCGGRPLEGVLVSDGVHFATTDFNGHYWLKSTTGEDQVWISMPSGYEVQIVNGWEPRFWYALDHSKIEAQQVQQFDFELVKADNDRFGLMVMTDVHIRGRHENIGDQVTDSLQFLSEVRPQMETWAAGSRNYAIVLGDMVQDAYMDRHNTGLPQYKSLLRNLGMMIFHVPGNHEFEKETFEQVPDYPENRDVKKYYRDNLGPSFYSFTLGKVHFAVLDGTIVTGLKTSEREDRVSPKQLSWLRGNLQRIFDPIREDVPEKLVICCHQPLFNNTGKVSATEGCLQNRNDVIKIISECNISEAVILSGHIHCSEIVNDLALNGVKINQYTHPAVCGPFWMQDYNWDDSPNGWTEYAFNGGSFVRRQHAFNADLESQMTVTTDQTTPEGGKCLVINVPAYEKDWSVRVQKNMGDVSTLSQQKMPAPKYGKFYAENADAYTGRHNISPRAVWHHFVYPVADSNAVYKVVVTEPDGTEHEGKYVFNN